MERGFMKKGVVVSHVVVKGSRDRRQGELWSLLRETVIGHEVMEWGFMMKGVVIVITHVVLMVLALWAGFVMCNSLQHIMPLTPSLHVSASFSLQCGQASLSSRRPHSGSEGSSTTATGDGE